MKNYIMLFLLGPLCLKISAQVQGEVNVIDRDAFYVHYTPPNLTTDDFTYQRISGKFSMPLIMSDKFSAFNTIGADLHIFDYDDNGVGENSTGLDRFYNINYSLLLRYKFSDKWSLNALALPFLLSNLEESIEGDDFNVNGTVFLERTFLRKRGGYLQLGFGVGYFTLNGTTAVSPNIQLKARFNERWSAMLGLPNTYVKWDINEKHSLKMLGDINDFSANLNGGSTFDTVVNADRAVFTVLSAGLEYNYWITDSLGIMFRATQAVWDNYELRNSDDDSIYEFDTSFGQPFISVGIKFNPIRAIQNSLNPL